jgi:hypothetical protein
LLQITETETHTGEISIFLTPEASPEPNHRVSGSEHDNEQEDTDENDVARANFIVGEIVKHRKADRRHSFDFMEVMEKGQLDGSNGSR